MGNQCCSATHSVDLNQLPEYNYRNIKKQGISLQNSLSISSKKTDRNQQSTEIYTNRAQITERNKLKQSNKYESITYKPLNEQTNNISKNSRTFINMSNQSILETTLKNRTQQHKQILKDASYHQVKSEKSAKIQNRNIIYPNGDRYQGQWKSNKANGKGVYKSVDGVISTGNWVEDMLQGQGEETYPDGSHYIGDFVNGKKDGKGIIKWEDGSSYSGEFKNGNIHGQGEYIWPNQKYIGEWNNSDMHGFGTFEWDDGRKYTGQYKNGLKHGYGEFFWPDGRIYKGLWQKGNWVKGIYMFPSGDTKQVQNRQLQ